MIITLLLVSLAVSLLPGLEGSNHQASSDSDEDSSYDDGDADNDAGFPTPTFQPYSFASKSTTSPSPSDRYLAFLSLNAPNPSTLNLNILMTDPQASSHTVINVGNGSQAPPTPTGYTVEFARKPAIYWQAKLTDTSSTAYSVSESDSIGQLTVQPLVRVPSPSSDTNMRVCVFSDFTEYPIAGRLAKEKGVSLSAFMEQGKCDVNLFTSALTFVEVVSATSGMLLPRYRYSPFMVRNEQSGFWSTLRALERVPSIIAMSGKDLDSTPYFSTVEVNGVAFVQIAVDFFSNARSRASSSSQPTPFNATAYADAAREDLLLRLECTLRRLASRSPRPWIVVYILSALVYSPSEHCFPITAYEQVYALMQRYKVDLFLTDRYEHVPKGAVKEADAQDAVGPKVIFTTMKPCSELELNAHKTSNGRRDG